MIVCPFYLEEYPGHVIAAMAYGPGLTRLDAAAAPIRHRRGPQQVDNNSYIRRRRGVPTTGTRQQMAWEWELCACQTSVRYAALGDSIIARLTIQLKIT